jgi:hypothetical protein
MDVPEVGDQAFTELTAGNAMMEDLPYLADLGRAGAASWRLTTTGAEAHSAGIFREGTGYGAIYELARILDQFWRAGIMARNLPGTDAAIFIHRLGTRPASDFARRTQ